MTEHTDAHPPFPRLWHCPEGSEIQLTGETRTLTVEAIEGRYAVFLGGRLKVGRCHRVNQYERKAGQEKPGKKLMVFDSDGWRPLSPKTVNDLVHNLGTDSATPCFAGEYELLITKLSWKK